MPGSRTSPKGRQGILLLQPARSFSEATPSLSSSRQLFTKILLHKRMHFIKPGRVGSQPPKSFPLFKDTKHTSTSGKGRARSVREVPSEWWGTGVQRGSHLPDPPTSGSRDGSGDWLWRVLLEDSVDSCDTPGGPLAGMWF